MKSNSGSWHSARFVDLGGPVVHLDVDVDVVIADQGGVQPIGPEPLQVGRQRRRAASSTSAGSGRTGSRCPSNCGSSAPFCTAASRSSVGIRPRGPSRPGRAPRGGRASPVRGDVRLPSLRRRSSSPARPFARRMSSRVPATLEVRRSRACSWSPPPATALRRWRPPPRFASGGAQLPASRLRTSTRHSKADAVVAPPARASRSVPRGVFDLGVRRA